MLTRILNIYFQKESEWKRPIVIKHFNISMAISTAICIPLNFPQMLKFLKKTPVAFSHENKHLFSRPLPKTMPVCKGNKKSHTMLAVNFRKYYPMCSTIMTADPEIFFLRISITTNILCKEH